MEESELSQEIVSIDVDLPAKLHELFLGPARVRVAYGGRGSGKSMAFARKVILWALTSKSRILCLRELQNSIRDSVHSLLVEQIQVLGLHKEFAWGQDFLRRKDGLEFIFKGLRTNAGEIKSMNNIGLAWIEEGQSISRRSLELLTPTVRAKDSEIWITMNPEDEDDPVYHDFVTNADRFCKAVKINFDENPWFPDVLENERLRCLQLSPERYGHIWLGNFNVNGDGAVYAKWLNERDAAGAIKEKLFDPALPVQTAWDIGYSDYTTIWFFQTTGGEIRVIDYYENHRQGIQHYISQLLGVKIDISGATPEGKLLFRKGGDIPGLERRRAYRYGKHWVPHDAAHKLFAANGRSVIQQADDLGVRMYHMPALPQQAQIDLARATIPNCWFDKKHCAEGLRALRKYEFEFDEDRQRYRDVPFHNINSHAADAFELLAQVQKQPIIEKPLPAPTFWQDQKSGDIFFPPSKQGADYERI